jgi:hypothetical protein
MMSRVEEVLASEERRAKKVETLVALLRDPDLSDVVARLVAENPQTHSPNGNGNGNSRRPGPNPNGVTAKLRGAASRLPKPFVVADAVNLLTADGFEFPRNAYASVRDALYFMVRDHDTFRIAQKAKGKRPQKYQAIEE